MESSAPRVPRRIEGIDARSLPIGPEEAFVLSHVDGFMAEADIASAAGLGSERVSAALKRLEHVGAIRFEPSVPRAISMRPMTARPSSGHIDLRPAIEAPPERATVHHPAAALYDPGELDEEIDLDLPRKRRVLDLYYRLDSLTHYELLGLAETADKKTVKAAYYEVVGVFHPDRYFGKNLGSFKPKLEKVFARLTIAHDVLVKAPSREEYDAYRQTQRRRLDFERLLSDDALREAELAQARRKIEEEARLSERIETSSPPSASPSMAPSDPEARRRALARKLGRSSMTSLRPPPSQAPPPQSPEEVRANVAQDLKRRYEQRIQKARAEQVQRYIDAADAAILEKNAVSATNALRIAVQLVPDDPRLGERLTEVQQIAAAELADSYIQQAQYEERNGRFAEAARSYERALAGRETPRLHERLAHCLVESQGDAKLASEHAKKAVNQAPNDVAYRVTLGRVFLLAGMKQSAISEFERAAALAPGDGSIKEWLKRARRGDV